MLKRPSKTTIAQIALGIFLVVFAGMTLNLIPRTGTVCDYDAQQYPENCTQESILLAAFSNTVHVLDIHNGLLTGLGTVAIAIFTIILAQTSIQQGKLTKRSLRIAEDSLTIAKWPYLYIKSPVFITPLGGSRASDPPVFEYWMVVFGESPAIIRRLYQKLVFSVDIPAPADERESNWETPDWFIKQGDGWERQTTPIDMSDGARAAWRSPQSANKKYYFVGCVIYDDAFGNQHELGFCYWAPRAGGPGIKCGGSQYNYNRRSSEDNKL